MAISPYNRNVFINCPFDPAYRDLFRAIVFAVVDCGFEVRCAMEIGDAAEVRIDKIRRLIEESRFGIHDLSRTELDDSRSYPGSTCRSNSGCFSGPSSLATDSSVARVA